MVAKAFELYAAGGYTLLAIRRKARELGLTHWRRDGPMTKSEIHRMFQNPIYTGDFRWLGKLYQGSRAPLITREVFQQVQAVLTGKGKGRRRYVKQRHPFMGLLTCARCGCAITAERKKGRYVYYQCTGFKRRCGNTYIRQEALSALLGTTVRAIAIPPGVADAIAAKLRKTEAMRSATAARPSNGSISDDAPCWRSWTEATTTSSAVGLLRSFGRGVRGSGKRSANSWMVN